MAVSCGYVGYRLNADEDPDARRERIERARFQAERHHIEKHFLQLSKFYDSRASELTKKVDLMYKMTEETQNLSVKVVQHNKKVSMEIEKLQKLLKVKDEIDQTASSLRRQKRTLDAEVRELSKLVKIKEDLQARSRDACSSPTFTAEDELHILSSKVQERNRALEAEIKKLMELLKKKELQAKSEALDEAVVSHLGSPLLRDDDPAQIKDDI
ncbi:hypothetical protein KP509_11G080600 [Ceratopteris richardii]|nr:hypothetical protein KP509_11G080600 [Ceratopteris richardii]